MSRNVKSTFRALTYVGGKNAVKKRGKNAVRTFQEERQEEGQEDEEETNNNKKRVKSKQQQQKRVLQ